MTPFDHTSYRPSWHEPRRFLGIDPIILHDAWRPAAASFAVTVFFLIKWCW
jgi:hypothetical protein